MMDLVLSNEQLMIKNNVRRFLEKEVQPRVEEYEELGKPVPAEVFKSLVPFGFIGGQLPEEAGGADLDYTTYFIMIEELSAVWPSLRSMVSIGNSVLTYIYSYGTEEQRKKYVEPLLTGDKMGFFALTEPNVGSDASGVQATATLQGDSWVLNGTKMFITNGAQADIGIVFAQTDKSKGAGGITAFLVEKNESPFAARSIKKMGMHSCPTAELVFEDCRIPRENVLGEIGQGLKLGLKFLNSGRALFGFVCAGVAQACVDASIKYATGREQFGRKIGGFQLIQEKIADMLILTSAMRLLGFQAADMLDKGLPCRKEASMAKIFSTESVLKVADMAIQIHGGYGYSREFPVERLYRDVRHLAIAEGTNEIQRLIIGREVLGISAFK